MLDDYVPRLYDIHRHFEGFKVRDDFANVEGNEECRIVSTLLFPIRKCSIVIKGPSGSGKTTIVKGAATLVWGQEVIDMKVQEVLYLADTSDKGMLNSTLANRIANVCTHCVAPELQNAIRNERVEAILKLWMEKESYPYLRSDHGGRIGREIILRPLPIFTSIATENKYTQALGEEMERRFFPFYTIANKDLNEKIHASKADRWMKCRSDIAMMSEAERTELRCHIQDCMSMGVELLNPCAGFMRTMIPSNYVVSNSMINYWMELVAAFAIFHHPKRITFEKDGLKYLLATPEDNYLAWMLGGSAIVMASLNIPDLGREIIDILPLRDEMEPDAQITVNEIVDALSASGHMRTKKQIMITMKLLESANYAKLTEFNKDAYYKTQEHDFETTVDWATCIESAKKAVKENQSDVSKEYIKRFCEDPETEQPFTGAKLKILDTPYEKPRDRPREDKKAVNIDDFFG